MAQRARIACAACVIAAACGAAIVTARGQPQTPSTAARTPPHRDPRIETLVADAMTIPSEFASDALLRVAGSGRVDDAEWRREMLETAYMRAYAAQEPYRRTSVGVPADTRQGATTI